PVDQAQAEVEALGFFEVDGDALFPTIQAQKEGRVIGGERRSPAAAHIAAAGSFQFINGCAVIGQQQCAVGAGERMGEVEHADSRERSRWLQGSVEWHEANYVF